MKLVVTTLSTAAFGIAYASLESLRANIQQVVNKRFNQTDQLRAFQGDVANGFDPINGYGCWCYLDGRWRNQAKSEVVDDMDASCRDLINSYKCIEMDAWANGIEDCDAQAVPYVPHRFNYQICQ